VELLRRRCQINRGKALLSRSNRQRGERRERQSELDRDMSLSVSPIVEVISHMKCTNEEYDVDFKAGKKGRRERETEKEGERKFS